MYLTYDEYIQYGGELTLAAFTRLEYKARKEVEARTQNRLSAVATIPESVKRLMFELIDLLSRWEQSKNETMSGYSNDGVTISLRKASSNAEIEGEAEAMMLSYLSQERDDNDVPLLYLGV
jgi:hypothetical protein